MTGDGKRRALGRGLDALLPAAPTAPAAYGERSVFLCAIEKLAPQKGQPRQRFEDTHLVELSESIRQHGLLQPIVVRRAVKDDTFEIIAGERRWRAAQRAGLREVMVVVKDVSPPKAFELAIIENVQRADLNPVELAEALQRLVHENHYTQETLAERLGKDRTSVANTLRLLKLPERVRAKIVSGELSEGHARALLGATDASAIEQLADKVLRGKLSVRATEALVRDAKRAALAKGGKGGTANGDRGRAGGDASGAAKSPAIKDLEARLSKALGTRVKVRDAGNKGEVVIPYADLDALDRLIERLA
jgi:ParB family chromosome partitioning protein